MKDASYDVGWFFANYFSWRLGRELEPDCRRDICRTERDFRSGNEDLFGPEVRIDEARREALINTLVHADHQSSLSITVIKQEEWF